MTSWATERCRSRRGAIPSAESERLIAHFRGLAEDERPALWFTYHVYYKAPDWIGPRVAAALNIPYVVAEGSRAAKRADGPWSLGHKGAEEALDRADLIFTMTDRDRPALEQARPAHQNLVELPPFIDEAEWGAPIGQPRRLDVTPRLIAVAMMRQGDKLKSYRILAEALTLLRHLPWSLDIVGDGEARAEVEAQFAAFTSRTRFHGMCDTERLRDLYGRCRPAGLARRQRGVRDGASRGAALRKRRGCRRLRRRRERREAWRDRHSCSTGRCRRVCQKRRDADPRCHRATADGGSGADLVYRERNLAQAAARLGTLSRP